MMQQKIDFYLLKPKTFTECLPFAAQLAQKAYNRDQALRIEGDLDILKSLDEQLWQIDAFLPHHIDEVSQTLQLCRLGQTPTCCLRLRLSNEIQPFTESRLLQIVPDDDALKSVARTHYKQYRQQPITLNTHNI